MNREEAIEIYKKYNLAKDDIFTLKVGGKTVYTITRGGIERIQSAENIKIEYKLINKSIDNIIIKATATNKNGGYVESYGESSPKNTKQAYPVAMAEKRAKSRVVLMLAGLYERGLIGEDETIVEPEQEWNPTQGQRDYAEQLFESAIMEESETKRIREQLDAGINLPEIIEWLKESQPEGNLSQGDILKKLKKQGL